jgi:hypothetical protein
MDTHEVQANVALDALVVAKGSIAREVAKRYLDMITSYWRGNQRSLTFESLLADYRVSELPRSPSRNVDDAYSPHGGGGRGIHWHETPFELIGHITGTPCGYVVPLSKVASLLSAAQGSAPSRRCCCLDDSCPERLPMLLDGAIALFS